MIDNRGCSGGTGVDIVAFGTSDMSQHDFVVQDMKTMDNSLLKIAKH